jgi:SecD/SecF fusion protein
MCQRTFAPFRPGKCRAFAFVCEKVGMNKQHSSRILLVVAAVLVALWTLVPTFRTLGMSLAERVKFDVANPEVAAKAIKLGLDLQGGTHLVLEVDKTGLKPEEAKDAADRSLEVVRNRIDQFGVSEPDVRKSGDSRLVVELAGVNPDQAKELLSSTAQLEFKLVREQADVKAMLDRIEAVLARGNHGGKDSTKADTAKKDSNALAMDTSKVRRDSAAEAARSLFTSSTEKAAPAADTTKKATAKDYKARAFYSYLVPFQGGIGVESSNQPTVDAILKRNDVQGALRASETEFVWGRHIIDVGAGKKVRSIYVVKRRAEMKGDIVADAIPEISQGGMKGGEAEVVLKLKGRGPKEFSRITGANIGRQLAVVLDGAVFSAPVIQGRITGGTASITGMKGIDEARQLSIVLRAGALPAPMRIVEERSVGASLGADNVSKGIFAAIFGILAVMVFMFLFYHGVGGIANAALVLNGIFTMAVMAGFRSTLTLPGIAGLVLALGMAVDANVLIYERIREELRHGKSIKAAVDLGYKRAFASIFDGHFTNVLTAFVLYQLGTGPIKGFGLTLTIACLISLVTAVFCTRIVFDIWLAKKDRKTISIGHSITYFENAKLNILGNARKIGLASAIVVGVIVVSMLIPKGRDSRMGINWGTDFTGGVSMTVDYHGKMDPDQMISSLEAAGLKGVNVKTLSTGDSKAYSIGFKTSELDGSKAQEATVRSQRIVREVLGKDYPAVNIIGTETIGPKIGSELRRDAFFASLLSLAVIIFYVWFRFGKNGLGFGIAGVLTLIHDSVITLGLFIVFGLEVDMTVIAAILTLIGYSLNDSIVIFDRIREDAGKYRKEDFEKLVNNAINETLSRTIMTSVATLIAALALWVLGGPTLRNFSLALVFGIIVGTYSSIAISSPIVVWWVRRKGSAGMEDAKSAPRVEARVRQA